MDADELFDDHEGRASTSSRSVFDYPYMTDTYDQVFCPEYKFGAMENLGCVTYTERMVFRSKVTEAERERRAEVILHEMSHMWFGDLVTMRWWNDLWLNESFATYMAYLAKERATRFTNSWVSFATDEKTWAYRQDQLPTTHPIVADIPDVEATHLNFDGITYAKGASVLKQLVAWVGEERFFDGLRRYFKTARVRRTPSCPTSSRRWRRSRGATSTAWSKEWLETAGVNTIWCRRTAFVVAVTDAAREYPTLRSHRMAVGLFDVDGRRSTCAATIELDVVGERTEVRAGRRSAGRPRAAEPQGPRVREDPLRRAVARRRSPIACASSPTRWRGRCAGARCGTWCATPSSGAPLRRHRPATTSTARTTSASSSDLVGRAGRGDRRRTATRRTATPATDEGRRAARERCSSGRGRLGLPARLGSRVHRIAHASTTTSRSSRGLLDGTDVPSTASRSTPTCAGRSSTSLAQRRQRRRIGDRRRARARPDRPRRALRGSGARRHVRRPKRRPKRGSTSRSDSEITLAMLRALVGGFQPPDQDELLRPYADRVLRRAAALLGTPRARPRPGVHRRHVLPKVYTQDVIDRTDALLADEPPRPVRRILTEQRFESARTIRARAADV